MEQQRKAFWQWSFWQALLGVASAHDIRPFRQGKHAGGKKRPADWFEKQKRRRKIAEASRKINRQ